MITTRKSHTTVTRTLNLEQLAAEGLIHPSWVEPLRPVQSELNELASFLQSELNEGRGFLPAPENLMRAFQIPSQSVRVVLVGQDPYPTPGHAIGLAFAVAPDTKPLPRSLSNILKELSDDLGESVTQGEVLLSWPRQGVMLLNRVLSVQPGAAGSHRNRGWEAVTECALRALDSRPSQPLVAVLWGNDAQSATSFMPNARIISSAHPSPLSASRGFFGSHPFSQANEYLSGRQEVPIEWVQQTPVN